LKELIFPGWAMPDTLFRQLPDFQTADTVIADYGFFRQDASNSDFVSLSYSLVNDLEHGLLYAHSMGTMLALKLALKYPAKIRALILFAPFARFSKADNYDCGRAQDDIKIMKRQLERKPEQLLKSFYRSVFSPEKSNLTLPDYLNMDLLQDGLDFLMESDCRDFLAELNIPVLILQGDEDLISGVEMAAYLEDNLPNTVVENIPGAGHALPFTHYRDCSSQIKNFLESL
jgi:pimeloyl-[acyl-carrier protein] methyl ester esterase